MSSRKPRNQKGNKKKLKNAKNADEAKFFVLAPNVLEKLGINLGSKTNENHSKEDLLELYDTGGEHDTSQKNKKYNQSESNEINTSLSETAVLMKNSVLLSPTFSHNTIEGTSKDFVNISNIEGIDTYLNDTYNKNEVEMVKMKPDPANNIKDVHSKAATVELIKPLDIINTINGDNENATNEVNQQNIDYQSNLLTDDPGNFSDFVFKVPYSQTNNLTGYEVALNTVEQNKNKVLIKNVVVPTQSNNIQPKLVLNTVDREIVKPLESNLKSLNNNSKSFDFQELHQNNNCNDSKDIKRIDKRCEISTKTIDKEKYQLTTSSVDNSSTFHTKPTEKAGEESEKNIEVQNSSLNNNVSTNCIAKNKDKVKEIADYLSKYARKATLHTKRTKVMSKSTIQGVEKPGGELEVNKSGGLTYERINKQAPKKHISVKHTEVNPFPESRNIDYEGLPTIMNQPAYCNCYDFGSFLNYDENIHFSDRTSLQIQNEVIYEIYNDEDKSLHMESDSFVEITEIDQSDVLKPICWNIFRSKENNVNDKISANMANPNDNDIMNIKTSLIEVKENSLDIEQVNKPQHTCNVRNTDVLNKSPNSNVIIPISQQKQLSRKDNVKNNNKNDVYLEDACSTNINDKSQMCSESVSPEKHVTETAISVDRCKKLSPVKTVPNVVTKSNEKKCYNRKLDEKVVKTNPTFKKGSSCNLQVNSDTNFNKGGQKRKRSLDNVAFSKKSLKCGVCDALLSENEWDIHSEEVHCFIAWHSGQDFNNIFVLNLKEKLDKKVQTGCDLKCTFCYVEFKETPEFIEHVKKCKISKDKQNDKETKLDSKLKELRDTRIIDSSKKDKIVLADDAAVKSEDEQTLCEIKHLKDSCSNRTVKCGVCLTETSNWIDHISKEHKYIAWKYGEKPLECCDENDARIYLQNILKEIGELVCYKCGLVRKQARAYLKHIKACDENISFNFSIVSDISQVLDTSCLTKCGVCGTEVNSDDWTEHITKEHEYMAWKEGEEPLDTNEEEQIRLHLHRISKQIGGLTCPKCGIVRKYAKHYIDHIKDCTGQIPVDVSSTSISNDSKVDITETPPFNNKCGVCSKQVDSNEWIEHIFKEHEYFAWKEGDTPLNIEDKDQIKEHLFNLNKMAGGLKCPKCGIIRKYVKLYMTHIESCTGETKEIVKNESDSDDDLPEEVRCGVCKMEMKREVWISHIEENHNYLAWWDIEDPLDLDNEEEVNEHLKNISYSNGGLKCTKCNFFVKKIPKRYLDHIKTDCTKIETTEISVKKEKTEECKVRREKNELLECARCHKQIIEADWKDHAMKEHYNIAWAVGDTPINIKNQNSVDKYLKAYLKRYKIYRCKVCKLTRVSSYGFYAHIIVCGKSDEETEIFKEHCDICHEKYLCVYKSQHMTAHKESVLSKLRRIELQERNEKAVLMEQEPIMIVSGKRRAAQKAISVIGNISKEDNIAKGEDFSDTDESVKLDSADSDESESDVDSNISDLEHEQRATEKLRTNNDTFVEYAKTLPFDISDRRAFILKGAKDFAERYYTEGVLFPKWRPFTVDTLDTDKVDEYLPMLEQSCFIHFDDNVVTMKRFESIKGHQKASYLFIGGTIRQVCWVPANTNDRCDNYLTVVCHDSGDIPKHNYDEIVSGPGSIQIWNCGHFDKLGSLSMVIVHDYGVVWSAAWCPSGARDTVHTTQLEEHNTLRLGLLAAACSNGHVYIFSVPYPDANNKTMFIKVKPVAELRMTSNEERRMYQATSINWSRSKGHETILVGYSDGTICYYNISSSSPILTRNENGVDIFYPYNEIKAHSGCITGVGSFPAARGVGAVCSGSLQGAALRGAGGAGGAGGVGGARRSNYPVDNMFMSQHWPGAYVAGDTCLFNASAPNDFEFWGNTRRLGLVHTMAECAYCGLVATYNVSQIRLMRPYPAYDDIRKHCLLSIDVKHLAKKRKIKSDELGVVVEPLTYNDAIQKYGLIIKSFNTKSIVPVQPKPLEVCMERFPLNAVTSMDFCSSYEFHNKLAVGVQAGVVIITNVI